MKKASQPIADRTHASSWNLWVLLDPERWASPVLVQKHGLFIGYLSLLMMFYIAYIHQCEHRVRQISKIEKQNQELRSQYLFLKTELVRLGQLDKVVQRASVMGFVEMRVPPLALGHADLNKKPSPVKSAKPMQP